MARRKPAIVPTAPRMVFGTELSAANQKEALAKFVHRYTAEHVPAWARKPREDGSMYPVQFSSDVEWLQFTEFPVDRNGNLTKFGECWSHPRWPNDEQLRVKYGVVTAPSSVPAHA